MGNWDPGKGTICQKAHNKIKTLLRLECKSGDIIHRIRSTVLCTFCLFSIVFLATNFDIILDLQKIWKYSTETLYAFHLDFPNVNILYKRKAMIKPKKLTLTYPIDKILDLIWMSSVFSLMSFFLALGAYSASTLLLIVSPPIWDCFSVFSCLSRSCEFWIFLVRCFLESL